MEDQKNNFIKLKLSLVYNSQRRRILFINENLKRFVRLIIKNQGKITFFGHKKINLKPFISMIHIFKKKTFNFLLIF